MSSVEPAPIDGQQPLGELHRLVLDWPSAHQHDRRPGAMLAVRPDPALIAPPVIDRPWQANDTDGHALAPPSTSRTLPARMNGGRSSGTDTRRRGAPGLNFITPIFPRSPDRLTDRAAAGHTIAEPWRGSPPNCRPSRPPRLVTLPHDPVRAQNPFGRIVARAIVNRPYRQAVCSCPSGPVGPD